MEILLISPKLFTSFSYGDDYQQLIIELKYSLYLVIYSHD